MFEQELRDASTVKRWGIVRTIRDQTLAEHSYYVAQYARQICDYLGLGPAIKAATVLYALDHDVRDEIFTGDLPGPAKRALVTDRAAYDAKIAGWAEQVFGPPDYAGAVSRQVVKVADWMDATFEMSNETCMGNMYAHKPLQFCRKQTIAALAQLKDLIDNPDSPWAALTTEILVAFERHLSTEPTGPWVSGE